jgi:hypothetical protein
MLCSSKVQLLRETAKARAQQAAVQAQQAAQVAAQQATAQALAARGWMAPQLERAADYTTTTMAPAITGALNNQVAPRLSGALRSTARQVSAAQQVQPSRSPWRAVLAWSALATAVLAGAGAAGVIARRRHQATTAAESDPDTVYGDSSPSSNVTITAPRPSGEAGKTTSELSTADYGDGDDSAPVPSAPATW